MSFPSAAFHSLSALYEFVELDAQRDGAACRDYGVNGFPAFAVLGTDGKVLVPPDEAMFQTMFTPPLQIAATLSDRFVKLYTDAGVMPRGADVVIAAAEFLRGSGRKAEHDSWIASALKSPNAPPEEIACLKVYQGLVLRLAGQKDEGLALLKEAVPQLAFAEATEEEAKLEHGVAPFTVGKGAVTFGTVSSSVDALMAADGFAWLATLDGDIPKPKGLDKQTLAIGGATLAAVLNRPKDADEWLVYCRIRASQAYDASAQMAFCEGLVRLAEGKMKVGVTRLTTILNSAPGSSLAPSAGVIAYEALVKAGDAAGAKALADLIGSTYGDRLAPELKARLAK